jgi:PleD family two-component response regulator
MLTDEMLMRASTEQQMGFAATLGVRLDRLGHGGRILLVEDRDRSAERIMETLNEEHHVERETDPSHALLRLPDGEFDLVIVSLSLGPHPDQAQALHRLFAHAAGGDRRDGDPRSAHRPAQSRLYDQPLEDIVRGVLAARQPLSVLLLDIDYFKAVNDSYGHDAGDSVLREFAARVRRNIRGIDLACRLGG